MEPDTASDVEDTTTELAQSLTDKWWLPSTDPDERAALRERNLSMFEKKYPTVHAALNAYTPKSELVFGDDGQPDMQFAGTPFYDGNIKEYTEQQLKKYWRNPNRLVVAPPVPQTVDTHAGRFLYAMHERMHDAEIEFSVGRTNKHSFYGLVMGIGLGRHLPEFIEQTGCRNMFVLDPNLEGLYHSMELLDWSGILFEFQERNGDVFFYVGGEPQQWMDGIRYQTRASNTISIDGFYVYAHYKNSVFEAFSKKFNKESHFLMTGLGFFFDEQLMLRNTYANMIGRDVRTYFRPEKPVAADTPAIIVGCGPSLDANIEDIKRNADNAVIISCGSALGPLMDAGIRPDFQMELENYRVLPVIMYAASRHDLSDVRLVASSTVDREIRQYFTEEIYWFRPALCPFPIFSNQMESCLKHPDPTVVNVGLSFAQEMGFREFYLFGTDLGQKDSDQHHAKSSYHYTDESKDDLKQVFNIEVPANFGGKAMTSSGLFWALDTLQRAIGYDSGQNRYYNCSNGARINRATPKLSRTLDLPEPKVSREQCVRDIVAASRHMTADDVDARWQPEKMVDAINDMLDNLVDMMETHDLINTTDHLIESSRVFYGGVNTVFEHYATLVLRGTVNQILIACDYYLCRINNEDKYDEALEIVRDEYRLITERLREIATKHIRSLALGIDLPEDYLNGVSDEDGLTEEQREALLIPQDKVDEDVQDEGALIVPV
tara:strand:+ start:11615 stop:13768 length:2154 start_codon:yes stop_codon:yes gene_type:complete